MGVAALALLLLAALSACGGDDELEDEGGLATTPASTVATGASEELPPPSGPLDDVVDERIGDLELPAHQGAPQVREVGAEDARDLSYLDEQGKSAVVGLALFPSPARAKAYARQFRSVLASDHGFEPRSRRRFTGTEGDGIIIRLADGEGTEAAVWTTGPVFANVLADADSLRTVIERSSFGQEPQSGQ